MAIDERPRMYYKVADAKKLLLTQNTSSDLVERLNDLIQEAGELLEIQTRRRFDRRIQGIRRDGRDASHGGNVYEGNVLDTGDDLQELISVANGDGTSIALEHVELRRSRNAKYYSGVALINNTLAWTSDPDNIRRSSILLSGIWGYGGVWRTATTLTADISSSATSIAVAAFSTALERDMLIRIGSEMLYLEATATVSPLTVSRAQNGSTAAAHLNGATVYEFEPEPLVRRYIKRVIQWYSELDKSPLYGTVQVGDISVPVDMTTMPKDAAQIIDMLSRVNTIGSQR